MTTSYSPAPQPVHEAPSVEPAADPNILIAVLHSIGAGIAANGQPWPERHQLRGRQMALSDADCSLTGLRVVLEVLLAAERTRQNGEPDLQVGDRVMEGLIMAALGLVANASDRLQPQS